MATYLMSGEEVVEGGGRDDVGVDTDVNRKGRLVNMQIHYGIL